MAVPMANDPPFATLNHFPADLGIPSESDLLRIGIIHASYRGAASEPNVGPAAKDVGGQRYVAARNETAIEPAVEVAEIDVEILGLQTDIADEAHFEPGAHSPASVADAAARQARPGGVDVTQREPASEIRQEAIEPIAQPSTRGGEPFVACLAARSAKHRGGRLDARPVDVAFGTDDGASELPVIADGA